MNQTSLKHDAESIRRVTMYISESDQSDKTTSVPIKLTPISICDAFTT
jgi:hypothetical protein